MLPRNLFNAEHEAFRETVRKFYAKEVVPNIEKYEQQQHVDRELWNKAGAMGLLCATMPEAYGGSGVDRLYSMILIEEQAYAMDSSTGFSLHSDIVANYINNFGSEAQKHYWLTRMASGETVTAIAMTEPGTGSDLQAVRTTAVLDGDDYIINGSKIFITNGYLCDMAIVVCKTSNNEKGSANLSLIIVEADRTGFSKGKPLNKIGMKGQDTCELIFDHVRVPKENLLSMEGMGFMMLMKELAWERMLVAIICQAGAEAALAHTVQYTKEQIDFCRAYLDRCMQLQLEENLGIDAAAAAKYKISEMFSKVVDECLQLHGGYGYMLEYPIARAYLDNRANRIYAGTNEIMKELISRSL
ncbi:hypothetical protein LTR94_018846 [Friedmanniomyces endolithicus]|nr:hypothetical protein LTR94_018846 [Friedmanniomyces endolithicus]